MKLYKSTATITLDIVIVMNDEDEPNQSDMQEAAKEEWEENGYADQFCIGRIRQVNCLDDLPNEEWENACPRDPAGDVSGYDGNATCREILGAEEGER